MSAAEESPAPSSAPRAASVALFLRLVADRGLRRVGTGDYIRVEHLVATVLVGWGLGAGLPEGTRRVLFPLLGLIVGAALVGYALRLTAGDTLRKVALGLVLGGGAGNLVDRIGRVV